VQRYYQSYIDTFNTPPRSILEIGSRDGDDAEMLRQLGNLPNESVYVVEPHPDCYRNIIQSYPDFRVFEFAISDAPGVLSFNAIPTTFEPGLVGTSSLLTREKTEGHYFPERWVKVLVVTGRTILQLIDRREIDLIKIDVEGHTWEAIRSFNDDIRLLKCLHLEVEIEPLSIWEGQHHYEEIKSHMAWYGFEELYYDGKYWGELQGDSIWVRKD